MTTNRFRWGTDKVQFIQETGDDIVAPREFTIVGNATRIGKWHGSEWRSCKRKGKGLDVWTDLFGGTWNGAGTRNGPTRGWYMEFPQEESDLTQITTLLDIRVAAAVTLTLMAAR